MFSGVFLPARQRFFLYFFVVMQGALFFCLPVLGAIAPQNAPVALEAAVNPKPDTTDIILPMPCGASMAFKVVGIQAQGFLSDMPTNLGSDFSQRPEREYYERRYATAVSAPFSKQDLPKNWQSALPQAPAGTYYFYLIGKYEVSNLQWDVLMNGGVCPSDTQKLPPTAAKPKVNVSWLDALNFSAAYTEWLLQNHPEVLPVFQGDAKNIGYLRLPTESEWEYAARGGHAVPRASIKEQENFPLEQGQEGYSLFGVFNDGKSTHDAARIIGSKLANPLGIYDTIGNVSEMVMDAFHFSLGGRLHGSSGGFVVKGGGFRSDAMQTLPGKRDEVALFIKNGKNALDDMGFRLVLSGINTPAGVRPEALNKEWQKAGSSDEQLINTDKNIQEELGRLIQAARTEQEKKNLEYLRGLLKDNNIELERQKAQGAESLIRSASFMVSTIHNIAVRHKGIINLIESTKQELSNAQANRKSAQKNKGENTRAVSMESIKAIEEQIVALETSAASLKKSIFAAISFYRSKIADSQNYGKELFSDTHKTLLAEIKGDDLFAVTTRKALVTYAKHVELIRSGKMQQLTDAELLRDIVPENLRVGL